MSSNASCAEQHFRTAGGFFLLGASGQTHGALPQPQLVRSWVWVQLPANGQFWCSFNAISRANQWHSDAVVKMPLTDHPDNDGFGMQLCPFAGKAAIGHICGVDECKKKVCVECCMRRILPNVGKPPLAPLPDQTVVCARLHCKAVVKLADPAKRLTWTNCWKRRNITEPVSVRVSPCVQRAPGPMQAAALSVISEIHFNC